jgi:hypothetical protein
MPIGMKTSSIEENDKKAWVGPSFSPTIKAEDFRTGSKKNKEALK